MKPENDEFLTKLNDDPRLGSASGCVEILDSCLVDKLGSIIGSILEDEDLLQGCLKSSYRHANGFDKIVLLSGPNFKLRLHRFVQDPTKQPPPAEHVHNHRWPFASRIIDGSLCMDLFAETGGEDPNSPIPFHKYIYHSQKEDGGFNASYVGVRGLVCISESVWHEQGTTYCMSPEEMHRIICSHESVTTLMLTGKPISSTCNLLSNTRLSFEQTRTQPYDREQLLEILGSYNSKVSSS
jgi:hypothetical protein